jgi:AcrR family transcriptional regulator
MAGNTDTVARILDGTLRALARQGPRKLSMSDICDEAGIARGTLYRYFSSKEEVLEALGGHVVTQLTIALQEAIAADPEPSRRVAVVMQVMFEFWQSHPETMNFGRIEPGFTIGFIGRVMPRFRVVFRDALEDVLLQSEPLMRGAATVDDAVDMLLRLAFSHYFLPFDDIKAATDVLVGLTAPARGAAVETAPKATRKRRAS